MDIDKLFSGMAKAEIFGSGKNLTEGLYEIEVKELMVKESRNPLKPGVNFICEFLIVGSNNDDHPVGCTRSWVLNMSNPFAFGNISELVLALLGYENSPTNHKNVELREEIRVITSAVLGGSESIAEVEAIRKELGDPGYGVLVGKKAKLECVNKPTKPSPKNPNGGTYTSHKWSPMV